MATHLKVLGLTLDPKSHIHNISMRSHKPLQMIKAQDGLPRGRHKAAMRLATYKAAIRLALEYASSIWSPFASYTSINTIQVMQNETLRTATGCTQDTNMHLHDKTLTLPIHEHLQLHTSQYKQKTQHPSHPLHKHTTYFNTPRLKNTIFYNGNRPPHSHYNRHKTNMHHIHTSIVSASRHKRQ